MTPAERARQRHIVLQTIRYTPPVSARAWEALMLAQTSEAWSQLLQGHPVPADQLDHVRLARMRARRAA